MLNILGPTLGFSAINPGTGNGTLQLSAANTWFAMSFIGNGKTVSAIDLFASAIGGTMLASELTLDIYSTTSTGDPNASVSGPHNCGAVPSATWLQWVPNYATTDGVMYWAVVKNINASPGTNNVTFRYTDLGSMPLAANSGSALWGWFKNHTTDGSAWANERRGVGGIKVSYSDSTYDGTPFSVVAAAGTTNSVYAAREAGDLFTYTGPTLNVRGLKIWHSSNTGTPSAAARARLYSGSSATPTLVATSTGGPVAGQVGAGWLPYLFASSQALAAGTYRAVLGTTGADTSSNRYNPSVYTIKDDAASKALMPFGNMKFTYSEDGTTFAETDTAIMPVALILDNGAEFTVSGGGGIIMPRVHLGM